MRNNVQYVHTWKWAYCDWMHNYEQYVHICTILWLNAQHLHIWTMLWLNAQLYTQYKVTLQDYVQGGSNMTGTICV
jgi:hypothetical protein